VQRPAIAAIVPAGAPPYFVVIERAIRDVCSGGCPLTLAKPREQNHLAVRKFQGIMVGGGVLEIAVTCAGNLAPSPRLLRSKASGDLAP
jgi:hypothetical protein